ncbi:MAG: DNA replication and repair protein RecF [Bacteroidetes bacterium]|nr:DNA replication and repair protein RecF [Bacteroidota bacterium]
MLKVSSISLTQFKNYQFESFDFSERVIGICGKNGVGKTNLLDALHYLCFTKSYFTRSDTLCVKHGQEGFRIDGSFVLNDKKEKVVCILRETGKKELSINDELYNKFSKHIGHYPCVIIAPDDIQIITDGSEERRKFIDTLLSQFDAEYLQSLILYTKVLQQRNSLLKSFAENTNKDFGLLDILDSQLVKPGEIIFDKRKEFLVSFLPVVKQLYTTIAKQYESINLYYESELLNLSFAELIKLNRNKDCTLQRTTAGIHRDDIEFELNGEAFKNIASQGQRKSLLFALKLAEMEVLKKEKGFAPLLLLDDVFEKLDEDRISNLLQKVCIENEGQVFITDTNKERLTQHLQQINVSHQLIEL